MTIPRASLALLLSLLIAGIAAEAQQQPLAPAQPVAPQVSPMPARPMTPPAGSTAAPAPRVTDAPGAAVAPAPAPQDSSDGLGAKFQSLAAGISLRPPVGSKMIRGAIGSSEVVRFVDEKKMWVLRVHRMLLEENKPLPLTIWKDPQGIEHEGMLEWTVKQFQSENPSANILRKDTSSIRSSNISVGRISATYSLGKETNLMQQAIVRSSDLQYFLLTMTSPAPRDKGSNLEQDPGIREAVLAFDNVLDSVELLDQSVINEDREDRLFRTRTLFVNMTEQHLRKALQKEQWLRYMRDGKDIGYSYVVEETAHDLPRRGGLDAPATGPEGVLIGVRSRMMNDAGVQSDGESWLFCTFDRKYEAFSNLGYTQDPNTGQKSTAGELGISRMREKPIPDSSLSIGQRRGVSLTEEYKLEVTKLSTMQGSEPIVRDLPPYYLPQALGELLPRLVSLREPKTYLFATWVSDVNQVMYRYVDVGSEQDVVLGGKTVRATPISDRVGLEGSITTHYIAPDGRYLGSKNDDSKMTILTTDATTLEKLWQNINLTRPNAVAGK